MLSGSTLLRVVVLFVVAAVLAGLIQALWPHGGDDPAPTPQAQRIEPAKPEPSKSEQPQPAPQPVLPPVLPPSPIRPLSRPAAPPAAAEGQANAALNPAPPPSTGPAAPLAESPPLKPAQTETREAVDSAADTAGPRAVSVVDLNTGSLAELNGLRGGGLIGRAIVQRRPYTSVDQLLSKRVLSRSTYDRIKDQVTVH